MTYKKAKNKWNRKIYDILEMNENSVKLLRQDGSSFVISKSEFDFTYFELKE